MKKYREKPVEPEEIEAVQFTKRNGFAKVAKWCGNRLVWNERGVSYLSFFRECTGSTAAIGDWIIKTKNGCFFRLSAKEFADRYEPIDDEA